MAAKKASKKKATKKKATKKAAAKKKAVAKPAGSEAKEVPPQVVKINGAEYPYEKGQTVIQVAHENGIDVPHYCYHPRPLDRRQLPHLHGRGRGQPQAAGLLQDGVLADGLVGAHRERARAGRPGPRA